MPKVHDSAYLSDGGLWPGYDPYFPWSHFNNFRGGFQQPQAVDFGNAGCAVSVSSQAGTQGWAYYRRNRQSHTEFYARQPYLRCRRRYGR